MVIKLASCPLAPSVLGLRPKPPPSRREVFSEAFRKVTIPGGSGKERIVESYRAKMTAAARRGSLREGAGTALAVTEGASGGVS